ncbi:lanthionine synthetase C family protein [Sciscionella marina]|uniref:lanthionine synthetase C family protein n=1 Tax=Sciscionella marina TaxID=508770 RepID=UPI00037EE6CC|nr:lanthionine synthetase C family protein [Sciscionella marina]
MPGIDGSREVVLARLTQQLAQPVNPPGQRQSLASGVLGAALWHLERAHYGIPAARERAHTCISTALADPISNAEVAGLFAGLPAVAFVLHTAEAVIPEYQPVIAEFDTHLIRLAHRRVDTAQARIRSGKPATFGEYDLLGGLTGIGALLLRHHPGNDALHRVLTYLVTLTQPLRRDGENLPGWWVGHAPDPLLPTPGGHANLGLAHGITGPLALLSLAHRRGIHIDGHREAIERICAHLDRWQHPSDTGTWWPYWITHHTYKRGHHDQTHPERPSWCYGTPGIARAQQLAAIATGDTRRQQRAETALDACLSDPDQLDLITSTGLCHGWAGLYHTTVRAAADAHTPALAAHLPRLATRLARHTAEAPPAEYGFLDGATGTALALHTTPINTPLSDWDQCLLTI